jgi:hypothetical protein
MEKRQPFQQMLLGKLDICMQKTETRIMSFTYATIISNWIKDLNIRPEKIEAHAGKSREYTGSNWYR